MDIPSSSRAASIDVSRLLLYAGLVALAVCAYAPILGSFFVSDDFELIKAIADSGPLGIWASPAWAFFRPLTSCSMFLDYRIWGLNPLGFHLTNVLLHGVNGCLCAAIAAAMLAPQDARHGRVIGAAAGALFVLSPTHSEPVSWISGRTDVLATAFFLASFLAYLSAARRGDTARPFIACLLLFACALSSKEATIVLPLVVGAHWMTNRFEERFRLDRPLRWFGGLATIAIGYLVVRRLVIARLVGGYGSLIPEDTTQWAIARQLSVYMGRSVLPAGGLPHMWVGAALWIALATFAIRPNRFRALAAVAIAAQAAYLPALSLSVSVSDTQGERFLYLASAFTIVFIASVVARASLRALRPSVALLCTLAVVQTYALERVNDNWRTAARIAQGVLASIGHAGPTERLVVLNLPDNLQGAYVFRNGVTQAVQLFRPHQSITVEGPFVRHALNRQTDRVVPTRDATRYVLQLTDGGMWMDEGGAPLPIPSGGDPTRVGIERSAVHDDDAVVAYYSAGRLSRFAPLDHHDH